MAKRLCKMSRKQIDENLGDIHRLVVEPKFVCRSCARASEDKTSLCKPAAIPPKHCQSKPLEQQQACGLLAEAIPSTASLNRADKVRSVIERVKQKSIQTPLAPSNAVLDVTDKMLTETFNLADKQGLKQAKRALKKQHKAQKKLMKLAKKQLKLAKKQKKLERLANQQPLVSVSDTQIELGRENNLH